MRRLVEYLQDATLPEAPDLGTPNAALRSYDGDALGRGAGVYDRTHRIFYPYARRAEWAEMAADATEFRRALYRDGRYAAAPPAASDVAVEHVAREFADGADGAPACLLDDEEAWGPRVDRRRRRAAADVPAPRRPGARRGRRGARARLPRPRALRAVRGRHARVLRPRPWRDLRAAAHAGARRRRGRDRRARPYSTAAPRRSTCPPSSSARSRSSRSSTRWWRATATRASAPRSIGCSSGLA